MRLQEVRFHGNSPLNNAFNFARPIRLIYCLRTDLVKLWIKETATVLVLMEFDGFRHHGAPLVDATPTLKQ
jgi:hypothetical protein